MRVKLLPILAVLLTAATTLSVPGREARAGEHLAAVESEFRAAIRSTVPATVVCVPRGVPRHAAGFSSGVIVTADGLVLSDGDAGLRWGRARGSETKTWLTDVEVRVRGKSGPGFRRYRARVIHRDRKADTALLQILQPPAAGLPFVRLGRSDPLHLGQFTFALGTSFDEDGRVPPTLTAGVVAAFDRRVAEGAGGRFRWIYTSAAVNQGVNGGPLVDLTGSLIGTISTYMEPLPGEPHQFLGKAVPIDRLRAIYAGVEKAAALFASPGGSSITTPRVPPGRQLERAFGAAAASGASATVSLVVQRRRPISNSVPMSSRNATIPRYAGPVSGLLLSSGGLIATSLYNLTNVGSVVEPCWNVPTGARVKDGLDAIRSVTVHFPSGGSAPARVLGADERWGMALLQADLERSEGLGSPPRLPEPHVAATSSFEAGRFVLALGNPYGAKQRSGPLLTLGILSRFHPPDTSAAWRGHWQTDAGGLDTNCGGAAVDLEGRVLGLFTIWHPARHGRNSGVAFIVPWSELMRAAEDLLAGRKRSRALLGVNFGRSRTPARIAEVIRGTSAAQAGLEPGDILHSVDGEPVPTVADVIGLLGYRFAEEEIEVVLERAGTLRSLSIRLGARSGSR